MNIQKDRNAKLESAYSFMLKYSKITVCKMFPILEASLIANALEFSPIQSKKGEEKYEVLLIFKKRKSKDGIDYKKSKKVMIVFNKSQP